MSGLKVGAVIITMGNRPDELRALIDSVAKQDGDPVRVVVVGNGSPVPDVPEGVRTVELPENLGIPGGRNVGIEAFGPAGRDVDVLLFLDDDGLLAHHDTAELCRRAFEADPRLGIVSFRIADPDTGVTQRRHVPRLRASDPMRSSRVTTFLGGANAVRTKVFAEVGGLPDEFFYAHEETDLAWRALDAGWMIDYRSDMVLYHPTTAPSRHAVYHRMVARNRVWLARRNLPAVLVPVYLGVWLLLTLARRPSRSALKAWLGGFREGWTTPCGPRRPMKWRTVWRLTRLGRPRSSDKLVPEGSRPHRESPAHASPVKAVHREDESFLLVSETTHDGGVAVSAPPSPDQGLTAAQLAAKYGLAVSGARPAVREYVRQLWGRRHFILAFSRAKLTAQYSQAKLGQLWQVATPLLNAFVYFMIFGVLLNASRGMSKDVYIPFLVTGVFVFTFTQSSVMSGVRAISGNLGLVRALHFPRASLPISFALQQLQQLLYSMLVMFVVVIGFGSYPDASWALIVPVLVLQFAFNTGLALIFARAGAKTPDLAQLMPFVMRTWMYASGVMFSIPVFLADKPQWVANVLQWNPAAIYMDLMRFALIEEYGAENLPDHVWAVAGGWAVLLAVGGFLYFWKAEERYGRG